MRPRARLVLADEWATKFRELVWLKREIAAQRVRDFLAIESTVAKHVFLRLFISTALSDAELVQRWLRGRAVLEDLALSYGWGSRPMKAKLRALAEDAEVLEALQGAAARGTDVPLSMLAVLVIDASRESIDGLLPSLDVALVAADLRLDLLEALRTHAKKTPELDTILDEVDQTVQHRRDASPALALGPVIGIGAPKKLWFGVRVTLTRSNVDRPAFQGHIDLDSRAASWFRVYLGTFALPVPGAPPSRSTWFDATKLSADTLGLGRCEPTELPRWLAATARTLESQLGLQDERSSLRGTKRARVIEWLEGR